MKKWQEIEFLDFKERQIRRRTQKIRAIEAEAEAAAPNQGGLRFIAVAAAFIVVVGVGGFTYHQHQQEVRAAELARRLELAVTERKGEADFSTATTPFQPLKPDAKFSESFTIRQNGNGRTTVETSLSGSRLVVLDKALVEIARPVVHDNEPSSKLYVTATVKSGTLMVQFKKGEPRVEVKLPMGVSVKAQTGLFKVVVEDAQATVLVREGVVQVEKSDRSKKGLVHVDQRAIIAANGDWPKPSQFQTPETVWR